MIAKIALVLFGWRKTPERFVRRFAEYIPMYLRQRRIKSGALHERCRIALSSLAFERAKNGQAENPRLVNFVRELERICDEIDHAQNVEDIADTRLRSVLAWHQIALPLGRTGYSTG